MTTGQIVGAVVGAVVGFYTGGVGWYAVAMSMASGASTGMAIGGAIDPPAGPNIVGPRLNDLTQQGANYGSFVPRVYGTAALMGTVFWIENNSLLEHSTTESNGGKGGGGGKSETTTYYYTATFALGLCEGPISGVRRIWISGKLIYDAGSSDIGTIIASRSVAPNFRVYLGDESQLPDSRLQATLGVANTPAYRGMAYIVFDDLDLSDYGNTLAGAQIKVEVVGAGSSLSVVSTAFGPTAPFDYYTAYAYSGGTLRCSKAVAGTSNYVMSRGGLTQSGLVQDSPVTLRPWANINGTYRLLAPAGAIGVIYNYSGVNHRFTIYDIEGNRITEFNPYDSGMYAPGGYDYQGCVSLGEYAYIMAPGAGIVIFKHGWHFKDVPIANLPLGLATLSMFSDEYNNLYLLNGSGIFVCDHESLAVLEVFTTSFNPSYPWNFKCRRDGVFYASNSGSIYQLTPTANNLSTSVGHYKQASGTYGYDYFAYIVKDLVYFSGFVHDFTRGAYQSGPLLSSVVTAECVKSGILNAGDIDALSLTDSVRGYKIASVAAIRSNLGPIQGAWPFDVIQSGYKLRFKRRGGTNTATILTSELGAGAYGDTDNSRFIETRSMDSQLPAKVTITYLDYDREYDIGLQYAERLNVNSVNIKDIDMPLTLTAGEAAQTAEILLYMYWLERYEVVFNLPPDYNYLEPADVITVQAESGTYVLRLISINYRSDGILECTAKFNNPAAYSSAAVSDTGTLPVATISTPTTSRYELLDIPLMLDTFDLTAFPVAMSGLMSSWPGGSIFRSTDGGQTWVITNGFTTPSTMGVGNNIIGVPAEPRLIDKTSSLSATFFSGASLFSVTESQLLNGSNHFAYGVDGRWEIIAAQTCTLQGDGSYVLTDLLRGRYGTEWAMGLHAAGDSLILINTSKLQAVVSSLSQIGAVQSYKGVTSGLTIDSDGSRSFAYKGVNLECLSPVYPSSSRHPTTLVQTLSWLRRTRKGGEWRDNVDAELGETTEAYEMEIYSSGTYTTLKRTVAVSAPTYTYLYADQLTDFGTSPGTIYVKIYQMSASVGRGYPLVSSFTVLGGDQMLVGDTNWASVVLSMHMDGADNGTSFPDVKGSTVTRTGTSVVTKTGIFKNGTASTYHPGASSGNFLSLAASANWAIAAGTTYTIEFNLHMLSYAPGGGGGARLMCSGGGVVGWNATTGIHWLIQTNLASSGIDLQFWDGTGIRTITFAVSLNTWHNITFVVEAAQTKGYLDGNLAGTVAFRPTPPSTTPLLNLFSIPGENDAALYSASAYIDDLRLTKGVARYTANFTPAAAAFPDF